MSKQKISSDNLAGHDKPESAWLAINGNVYDFTDFAPKHPGGAESMYA